jgi:hypothetical protein
VSAVHTSGCHASRTWSQKSVRSARVHIGIHQENERKMNENKKQPKPNDEKSEFERFEELAKQLVNVKAKQGTPENPQVGNEDCDEEDQGKPA